MLDNERRSLLKQILNDPSSTTEERAEARRELYSSFDESLLGLPTPGAPAPVTPPPHQANAKSASPEPAIPTPVVSTNTTTSEVVVNPPNKSEAVNNGRSKKLARLQEILADAPTSLLEIGKFLELKTKGELGIDYVKEVKLRRMWDKEVTEMRAKQAENDHFVHRFDPIIIGKHKFHLEPEVRDEINLIRLRGIEAIKNCARHTGERCRCFWKGTRLELLAFRERFRPGSDEWKVATIYWEQLETLARTRPPKTAPPVFIPPPKDDDYNNDTRSPAWLGRRKK